MSDLMDNNLRWSKSTNELIVNDLDHWREAEAQMRYERDKILGELATARAERDGLGVNLGDAIADRDDWREIAIGLYDLGGQPLPTDAEKYAEFIARYEAKIKKGGVS